MIDFEDGGDWLCTMPDEEWMEQMTQDMVAQAKQDFEGEFGDRRQEIVFIGDNEAMKQKELSRALEECLLNDEEMSWGPEQWVQRLEDPFEMDEHEHEHDHEHDEEEEDDTIDIE